MHTLLEYYNIILYIILEYFTSSYSSYELVVVCILLCIHLNVFEIVTYEGS